MIQKWKDSLNSETQGHRKVEKESHALGHISLVFGSFGFFVSLF
jgi:hypothetical protein